MPAAASKQRGASLRILWYETTHMSPLKCPLRGPAATFRVGSRLTTASSGAAAGRLAMELKAQDPLKIQQSHRLCSELFGGCRCSGSCLSLWHCATRQRLPMLGLPHCLLPADLPRFGAGTGASRLPKATLSHMLSIWLILPVVICLSQSLSHACLSADQTLTGETADGSLNQI